MSLILDFLNNIWNATKPDPEFWVEMDEWSRENGYW